jgi:tape measure domain-containing protein
MAKDVRVEIKAEDRASNTINGVKRSLDTLTDKTVKVNVQAGAGALDGVASTMQSVGNAFSGGLTGVLGTMGGFGMVAAGVVTAVESVKQAFEGAGKVLIGYNADMEQVRIAFTSMLGSAQDAEIVMNQLKKFAADTPFEFKDIAPASQQLKAFGFAAQDLLPTLTAVGNASAGLGRGTEGLKQMAFVLGQIKATGKLMGQDVMQLSQLGIPVRDILAKNLGIAADDLADIGNQGISADTAIKALTDGMNERFPDMMKQMSDTYNGMWSTLADDSGLIFGMIGESLFGSFKSALSKVRDLFDTMLSNVNSRGLKDIFDGLVPDNMASNLRHVFDTIGQTVDALSPILENLWEVFQNIFIRPFENQDTSGILTFFDTLLTVAANGLNVMTAWWADLSSIVGAVYEAVYTAINGVINAFADFYNGALSGLTDFANSYLSSVFQWLSSVYQSVIDFVNKCLDKLGWVGDAVRAVASAVGAVVDTAIDKIQNSRTYQALTNPIVISGSSAKAPERIAPTDLGGAPAPAAPAGSSGGGSGAGRSGQSEADKLQKQIDDMAKKIADYIRDFDKKILDETGTAYEKGMANLQADIDKTQDEIKKASALGIDTAELQSKLDQYSQAIKDKLVKAWKEANEDIKQDTDLTWAQINDSATSAAKVQYQIDLTKLNREKETKLKEIALTKDSVEAQAELQAWYTAKATALAKTLETALAKEPKTWRSAWRTAMQNVLDDMGSIGSQMMTAMQGVAQSMSDGFTDFFTDILTLDFDSIGDAFSDMLKNMLKSIAQFLSNKLVTQLFNTLLGGTNIGSGITATSDGSGGYTLPTVTVSGARASGGPVSAGRAYLVGENGPELYIPSSNGTVANRVASSGDSQQTVVTVTVNNTTDQKMQATQKTSTDGTGRLLKEIIISTVGQSLYTNEGGIRDMVAGVRGG